MEKAEVYFRERQYFRQAWLWWLIAISVLVLVSGILIMGLREGHKQDSTRAAITFIALMIPVCLLLYFMNLETTYSSEGISYRFRPFHFKTHTIRWEEVDKAYIRKYKPMREFGGWGIRFGLKGGKAYNVSGNLGLQLELKNGRKILFGTSQENKVREALTKVSIS